MPAKKPPEGSMDTGIADDETTPQPGPDEAERDHEERPEVAPAAEVRPDDLSRVTATPEGRSAFPEEVVAELRQPLDPDRVRSREGSGGRQLEYLAGHDVKRRANEIFGFGNWGHHVLESVEIGAVEVASSRDSNKTGWHVGYRCVVRIWVRTSVIVGRSTIYETSGVGYGDGVEYTPAARVTTSELAMKEAETDALKRAFTDLGDQFGLILYAKDDERRRIDRERDRADTGAVVRRDQGGLALPTVPQTWGEIADRLAAVLGGGESAEKEAQWWLKEALDSKYGPDLDSAQRQEGFRSLSEIVMRLEVDYPDPETGLMFAIDHREILVKTFGRMMMEGIRLEGPPWSLSPADEGMPSYADWQAAHSEVAETPAEA